MAGDWLCEQVDNDFVEYEVEDQKLDIYLYWPGSDRQVPRPLDLLIIMVQENDDVDVIRDVAAKFSNVVFKVVIGQNEPAGLAYAGEINAKWATCWREQGEFLANI